MPPTAEPWLEVCESIHRALDALDRTDWVAYRNAFEDEFELDYSTWRPDSVGRWRADDWVDRVSKGVIPGCDATQHSVSNHRIDVDDDEATCTALLRAMHVISDESGSRGYELGGQYRWRMRRQPDGAWRATAVTLDVRWRLGDPGVLDEATRRVTSGWRRPTAAGCRS